MNISQLKSRIIALGLIKTKKMQKRFNRITGVNSFRHATGGIHVKNIETDEDVIKAWNKYMLMEDADDRVSEHTKKRMNFINRGYTDYSSQAYNNSADDL